ncbi:MULTISPECIES: hypothetical protein [Bradyrhizobium]|uniref:hypothetical protein n=1 Tax=Bradyrhizobium elkanii TaxID=29448 RepID=UPI002714F645|nr:hypothetical protein [Bradyrhizobium elkanii]WLB79156.1 hypothetical protein QIH83_33215 [Bradyrhizobium elkanii]
MTSQGDRAAATTGKPWIGGFGAVAAVTLSVATGAAAKPPGQDAAMMRMLACDGEGVRMEVYLPLSVALAGQGLRAGQTVIGYYALDLTEANKGKPLEPVRVTMSADKKTVTVDQYTRGLPPTQIPVRGGTVDFDQRFAKRAKCGPFQSQDPKFGN